MLRNSFIFVSIAIFICLLLQWMPVIRTSLGIAYNVLITGMSDTMDIAYKNTLGSRKYLHIIYIHYVFVYENRFQTMVLISSMFL